MGNKIILVCKENAKIYALLSFDLERKKRYKTHGLPVPYLKMVNKENEEFRYFCSEYEDEIELQVIPNGKDYVDLFFGNVNLRVNCTPGYDQNGNELQGPIHYSVEDKGIVKQNELIKWRRNKKEDEKSM